MTSAEAAELSRSLLPRISSVSGRDVAIARRFHDCRVIEPIAPGCASEVAAQNMHQRLRRCLHRRGLGADAD